MLLLIKILLTVLSSVNNIGGMERLKSIRSRFSLQHKVQIHHIIPRQHKKYLRKIGLSEDHRDNLLLMPTKIGMHTMNLRKQRLIHDGGHNAYNKYVKKLIDKMTNERDILLIQKELRKKILIADPELPWV